MKERILEINPDANVEIHKEFYLNAEKMFLSTTAYIYGHFNGVPL